jgi:hypothetical protein
LFRRLDKAQKAVFLAQTTFDLREQREAIKRDLQQHGYTVLPAGALPQVESEVKEAVRVDLAQCQMSIHLIGKTFSLVPEGGMQSLLEIQNELAIERGSKGDFSRLLWIPAGLQVQDERQQKVIEQLRMDPRTQKGADLLETFLEDLRTVIQDRLKEDRLKEASKTGTHARIAQPSRFGGCRQRARPALPHLRSARRGHHFAVGGFSVRTGFGSHPAGVRGRRGGIREHHEENLRSCDGALIFYGSGNECWLRRKLRELQKSPGYGRTKPIPIVAISLIPPRTSDKERFRTPRGAGDPSVGRIFP